MADQKAPQMQATLGLTGLTSNAMALIAPGAFLWLTFAIQANTGVANQPSTAPAARSPPTRCPADDPHQPPALVAFRRIRAVKAPH